MSNLYPPHFLGGYEIICHTVVGGLRRRGHQIRILTSDHRVAGVPEQEPDSEVERSLRLHGFYGHPWLNIVRLRGLERFNNRTLKDAIRRYQPDLVYVWNMGGISKSILLTLQGLGIPTVFYLSDHWIARGLTSDVWLRWWNRSDAPPLHQWLRRAWTASGGRRRWQSIAPTNPWRHLSFQRIYFCSRALRQLTAEAGFPVEHGRIIYCPIDVNRFDGPPHPPDRPLCRWLYVGRLAEDKGVMTALRALAQLDGQFSGQLSIYGRGEPAYESLLHRFTREHRLPVSFCTARPEEMPDVYRQHDALLFTSEWAEPFALTPLEAMSSGLPVVGTSTGGSAELFRHGENALTYTAGSPDELAARILEMQRNPVARFQWASAGREEVRQRCAESVVVEKIEQFLEESLVEWKPIPLPCL